MGSFILVVQTGVWLFFVGIFFFRGGGTGEEGWVWVGGVKGRELIIYIYFIK